jgi:hypothetical protein
VLPTSGGASDHVTLSARAARHGVPLVERDDADEVAAPHDLDAVDGRDRASSTETIRAPGAARLPASVQHVGDRDVVHEHVPARQLGGQIRPRQRLADDAIRLRS